MACITTRCRFFISGWFSAFFDRALSNKGLWESRRTARGGWRSALPCRVRDTSHLHGVEHPSSQRQRGLPAGSRRAWAHWITAMRALAELSGVPAGVLPAQSLRCKQSVMSLRRNSPAYLKPAPPAPPLAVTTDGRLTKTIPFCSLVLTLEARLCVPVSNCTVTLVSGSFALFDPPISLGTAAVGLAFPAVPKRLQPTIASQSLHRSTIQKRASGLSAAYLDRSVG